MNFSIIVPIYNVEKYLKKCIESLINQTYRPYEIILVNDGTKDNSQQIIDEYVNKYPEIIKGYIKENGGLSDARNYGVKKATGDYIVFVDSDDYIKLDLLETLNNNIKDNEDMIGYGLIVVDSNYNEVQVVNKAVFDTTIGEKALINLINGKNFFETAWTYAYNLKFWKENNFEYIKGRYHEDFGLTPNILVKAKKVKTLDYAGYYYYQNDNGIIRNGNMEKTIIKAYDMLYYFDFHMKNTIILIKDKDAKNIFASYLANAVINKVNELEGVEQKKYIAELNKRNVLDLLLTNNIFRKLKKEKLRLQFFFKIKNEVK